jgi:hypothetical protein
VWEGVGDVLVVKGIKLLRQLAPALSQEREVVGGVALAGANQAAAAHEAAELHGRLQVKPERACTVIREQTRRAQEYACGAHQRLSTSCGGVSRAASAASSQHCA